MSDPRTDAAIAFAKSPRIPEYINAGKRPREEKVAICAFLAGTAWLREQIRDRISKKQSFKDLLRDLP